MLRISTLLLGTLLLCSSCEKKQDVYLFSTFREPATDGLYLAFSHDGYNWTDLGGSFLKPNVGNDSLMRDPSVVRGPDGTFHMVWTCSWTNDYGFGYASSKDLVHWSEQKFIPVMEYEPTTVNVWAPELYYEADSARFIIVWASTIPYRFEKGIEDERNNHRLYYTTTRDFEHFAGTRLFLDPGYSVIDAVIVKRGTKDYVLVLKDNTRPERDLKVAFGQSPLGPWNKISEPFTRQFTEGPTVLFADNEWLIYFDAYRDKTYGAVKTKDFKNFEDVTSEISLPEGQKHGTVFMADEGTIKGLIKQSAKMKKAAGSKKKQQ